MLDAADDRGVQFMTMEYIKGNDLDRLVREGDVLPIDLALDCIIQAARGLEAAHAMGIVHRDVKPGNLMLDDQGLVRVLDLGLARLVEAINPFGEAGTGALTQSGTYMGTVDFMAPEQGVDSRRVDYRADIYSLGCTLCYLLTGRAPFDGPTVLSRLMAHQERAPTSLPAMRSDVPRAVDAVYQKMMAKQPADRFASMTEVITRLEACRSPSTATDAARSELQSFARSVIMKRATPKGTIRDTPVFDHNEPFAISEGLDRQADAFPVAKELKHAVDPLKSPFASGPVGPGVGPMAFFQRNKVSIPLLAVGALFLIGVVGLGYSRFPRSPEKPADDRGRAAASEPSSGAGPIPRSLSGEPQSPGSDAVPAATFDVATLYAYHFHEWRSIAVSANGHRALIGGTSEQPELLNIDTAKIERSFGWHFATITDVAITPDGHRGLVGTYSIPKQNIKNGNMKRAGTLRFWNMTTGQAFFPMQQPYEGDVTSVATSADGRRGLSGGRNGELTLWDLTTGERLRSLGPQQGFIAQRAMVFFPDGRRAATAGQDKLVHVWDLETGRELGAWAGHDARVTGLALSADGRRIATGGADATVILWDADSGKILHRFDMPPNDSGASVAFDTENHLVAAGTGSSGDPPIAGNLLVWDMKTFALVRRDERPFARHMAVGTLPFGRVITSDKNGIRIWTPRPPTAIAAAPAIATQPSNDPVDLIAILDRIPHKAYGDWQVRGSELQTPSTRYARLQVPCEPTSDYRINMKVELIGKEASHPLGLGLVVGGRQTEILIDTITPKDGKLSKSLVPNGRYSGLNYVDGVPLPYGSNAHYGRILYPSRPVDIVVTVRAGSIRMTCDAVIVVDWSGDPRQLIRHVHWTDVGSKSLFLSSSTSVLIHRMVLTPLRGGSNSAND